MNRDPRLASRTFKIVSLGFALLALASAAIVAAAQQLPDRFRSDSDDASTFDFLAAAPEAGFTVASTAVDSLSARPREVRATSEKVSETTSAHHRVPVVTDWSTKHVVFSKPKTAKDAARLEHSTRYKMQVARRNAPTFRKIADARVDSSDLLDRFRNRVQNPHSSPTKADPLHRDWSVQLNGNGTSAPTPTVGASQFPAKFSFDITAAPDCNNDFVVFNTNTSMLVAFNNLYTSPDGTGFCPGTAPSVMWAYDVSSNLTGVTSTSVALSEDGTQVVFIESSPTSGSVLHVLKWSTLDGGTITSPVPANDVTGVPPDYWVNNCGGANGGCMWSVPFSDDYVYNSSGGGDVRPAFHVRSDALILQRASDSNSAPYYDYDADILYVGTDKANIHQFVNVFNGGLNFLPTESTGRWPMYMNTTSNPALTGPIEDAASGRIFVSDAYGDLLYIETNNGPTTPGACSGQTGVPQYFYPCLAATSYNSGTNGVPDPPIVDSSLGTVMVFAGEDQIDGDPGKGHAFAAQALTTAPCVCGGGETTGGPFVFADFGPVAGGGSGEPIHDGDFDNNYYNSDAPGGDTPTNVTGFMYVCAIDPQGASGGGNTALRQISFDSTTGLISGVSAAFLPVAAHPYDICSSVTEVYNTNTNTDLIFFSVEADSEACLVEGLYNSNAPDGGCVMSFDITLDSTLSATDLFAQGFAAEYPEDGGTSGIIIDNISSEPQASSIYFTPLGDAGVDPVGNCTYIGCAVKLTQVGLQ